MAKIRVNRLRVWVRHFSPACSGGEMPDRVFEPTFWCGLHMSHFDSCQLTLIWLTHITLNYWQPTDSLCASSPIWASEESLARTREQGAEERRVFRKEGQEKELVATGVQLKKTKSGKTLFSSSGTDKYIMFLLVIATGSCLLHCSMDDFSKVNETRIKVLSSPPSR